MKRQKVYIIHSNGRPYFEAVELYTKENDKKLIYRCKFYKKFYKIYFKV